MTDRYAIEVDRRVVGVAVRVSGGYRFFTSDPVFGALEGRIFPRTRAISSHAARIAGRTSGKANGGTGSGPSRQQDGSRERRRRAGRARISAGRWKPASQEPPAWFRWALWAGLVAIPAFGAAIAALLMAG